MTHDDNNNQAAPLSERTDSLFGKAVAAITATLLLPVVASVALPGAAELLAPLALALPFISMAALEHEAGELPRRYA
ncbi:MAG: hypothetical protein OEZ06_16575 [Myxococcales bacterium]|nr:hypothetical protein [Myxococcales bacterium]